MKIRNYAPQDFNTVLEIWFSAWHSIDGSLAHPQPKSMWKQRLISEVLPKHEVGILDGSGRVLGFAALTKNKEPAELTLLYIDPRAQGAGLGSLLLEWAKERRPEGFVLSTLELNKGSRRFYERHGLRQTVKGINTLIGLPNVSYEWQGAEQGDE